MGSNSVISVLAFIFIFLLLSSMINNRNKQSYDNAYGFVKYTTARDISRNAIQVMLREIDTLSTIPATFGVSGNIDGGSYNVNGTRLTDSTLSLTSNGTFSDTTYKIITTLYRKKIPLPPSLYKGTFGIASDSLALFKYDPNKDTVDGRDHDINGNLLPASPDSVPPVEVITTTDSSVVRAGVGSNLNTLIGTPKIWVDPSIMFPNDSTVGGFKQIADTIITVSNGKSQNIGNGGANMGDSTNPIIVFCDGTNKTTGKTDGTFNLFTKSGWGILVVKGHLALQGNAVWHGAIIEYGNIPLTFSASNGNSQVFGGVLFGGANRGTYTLGGNSRFLHSNAALNLRNKIKDPYIYQIVDWYE